MGANLLKKETSPYLLQHADNPVHWMAWGEEAFARAAADDKPILLSIGYAACHWCHVMAHESFEDPQVAALMNQHFVNVKVDREERPDIDRIYMDALHAMGEQGGWPLTMFLAPDRTPFWGGTYFPKESRYGLPGFTHVLEQIASIWSREREKVDQNRAALVHALQSMRAETEPGTISPAALATAETTLLSAIDLQHGGLRGAPKFPQMSLFDFLWRRHLQTESAATAQAVTTTLLNICNGGIYDHLAGGISRYSVDGRWLVPHFEKMLYDNAQLILLLARVCSLQPNDLLRSRIEETARFVLDHMRGAEGAFTSSYDADSEGHEGKYYVWQLSEIEDVLGEEEARFFCTHYDVSQTGNWEGSSILNRLQSPARLDPEAEARLTAARRKLLARRNTRVPPAHDDKILADWNGLMIKALAEAGMRLGRLEWVAAAEEAFVSVLNLLRGREGLAHSWRDKQRRGTATADDFANLIAAGLSLYAATAKASYLSTSDLLTEEFIISHWDHDRAGFYFTRSEATDVLVRARYSHDDATPGANGTMIATLNRLHLLTGKAKYREMAQAIENMFSASATQSPFSHGSMLSSLQEAMDLPQAVLIGGSPQHELIQALMVLPIAEPLIFYTERAEEIPAGHPACGKAVKNGAATLYLCRGTRCSLPVNRAADVAGAWHSLD